MRRWTAPGSGLSEGAGVFPVKAQTGEVGLGCASNVAGGSRR